MRTSGTIARIAGSTTGRPLSASQTAETSSASSRSTTSVIVAVSHPAARATSLARSGRPSGEKKSSDSSSASTWPSKRNVPH